MANDFNFSNVLLQVLHIIQYADKKEEFLKEFWIMCFEQTLAKETKKLPENIKAKIREKLENEKIEKIPEVLKNYFNREDYLKTLQQTLVEELQGYIKTIIPLLPQVKKRELENFLSSISIPLVG